MTNLLKKNLKTTIEFFKAREAYKKDLIKAIKKYGISNLPKVIQDTIPVDMKALYEMPWYLNLFVWYRIVQISILNAKNDFAKKV